MEWTDDDLLKRWRRSGDGDAFRELTVRYGGMVHATCLRVLRNRSDAEDVAQECFESLATSEWGPKRNVGGWLHRVATHRSISLLRSSGRRSVREERYAEVADASHEATWDEVYRYIDEALEGLPEKFRVPVCAHFLQQRTHESIAKDLRLQRSAVSYRIRVGVDRIREELQRKGVTITGGALMTLMAEGMGHASASAEWLERVGRIALSGQTGVGAGTLPWTRSLGWLGAGAATLAAVVGIWIVVGGENGDPLANPVPEPQVLAQPVSPIDVERREVIAVLPSSLPESEVVVVDLPSVEAVAVASVLETEEALDEGASISGRVIDPDGVGVPGFLVHVMLEDANLNRPVVADFWETFRDAITDSEGKFTIDDIHFSGQVRLLASGSDYFDVERHITLYPGEERGEIEFLVDSPSDDFIGRVFDALGKPLGGAWVVPLTVSHSPRHSDWRYWRRTDERGEFFFPVSHRAGPRYSQYSSTNWNDVEVIFAVYSGIEAGVFFRDTQSAVGEVQEFQMSKPGLIHGTVSTAEGDAAAGYSLEFSARELEGVALPENLRTVLAPRHLVITDELGNFAVEGLAPSIRYVYSLETPEGKRISAHPPEFSSTGPNQSQITSVLQPGSELEWNLVVQSKRWMEGTIRVADSGKVFPLSANITVGAYDEATKRQVGGGFVNPGTSRYRMSLPSNGQYVVVALYGFFDNRYGDDLRGAVPWSRGDWMVVQRGTEDLEQDLTVEEPFVFSVRVIDALGLPCESVLLNLSAVFPDYMGDMGARSMQVRTDRDGRYSWYAKPREEVWISTNVEGFARSKTAHVVGISGETLDAVLVLRARGSISGRIIRQGGSVERPGGLMLKVWNEQGQELGTKHFNSFEDGTFLARGMLTRDRVYVNLQYRREWVWSEPLLYEGPADVDLDLGDIIVPE